MKKIIISVALLLNGCAVNEKTKNLEQVSEEKEPTVLNDVSKVDWDIKYTSGKELLDLINAGKVKPGYIFKSYTDVELDMQPTTDGTNVRMNPFKYSGISYELISGKLGQNYLAFDMPGRKQRDDGKYVGVNAFGVQKQVDKVSVVSYVNAVQYNKRDDSPYGIKVDNCIIPSYDVKDDASNIKMEYIASLFTDAYISDNARMQPTINFTVDAKIQEYFFESRIISARLINLKNNKVYDCLVVF